MFMRLYLPQAFHVVDLMPHIDTNDVFCRYRLPISQWRTVVYDTEYINNKYCMFHCKSLIVFALSYRIVPFVLDEMMKLNKGMTI